MDIFSARVKWLREKRGLSQKELAKLVGMSPAGYGKIENGQREPSLEKLVTISHQLNESADFLLGIIHYEKSMNGKFSLLTELKANIHGINLFLDDLRKKPIKNEYNPDLYGTNMRFLEDTINKFEKTKQDILLSLESVPFVPESYIIKIKEMIP